MASLRARAFTLAVSIEPNGHFHLRLNDSTVAGNQAPGGISGIDGEESDQLALSNSIVTSPSGPSRHRWLSTASVDR